METRRPPTFAVPTHVYAVFAVVAIAAIIYFASDGSGTDEVLLAIATVIP
jgi:hypothetical protein